MKPLPVHHEVCTCGHCRCEHHFDFAACLTVMCTCSRYTWPGKGADLPADHPRGERLPMKGTP